MRTASTSFQSANAMVLLNMVYVCDLAQNRLEAGKRSGARHVRACVRIAKHRFEGVATAPLRVVDDVSAVKTGVNVGGNEPRLMAHRVLCCFDQHAGESLLVIGGEGKDGNRGENLDSRANRRCVRCHVSLCSNII